MKDVEGSEEKDNGSDKRRGTACSPNEPDEGTEEPATEPETPKGNGRAVKKADGKKVQLDVQELNLETIEEK